MYQLIDIDKINLNSINEQLIPTGNINIVCNIYKRQTKNSKDCYQNNNFDIWSIYENSKPVNKTDETNLNTSHSFTISINLNNRLEFNAKPFPKYIKKIYLTLMYLNNDFNITAVNSLILSYMLEKMECLPIFFYYLSHSEKKYFNNIKGTFSISYVIHVTKVGKHHVINNKNTGPISDFLGCEIEGYKPWLYQFFAVNGNNKAYLNFSHDNSSINCKRTFQF